MRTTVTLDDDVHSAVRRMQRDHGIGPSEALNRLARAGMSMKPQRRVRRQRTAKLGLRIDVTNVAEALELLDGAGARP
jgi:uncharacterized protein YfiM (DUF2279 family)